METIKRHLRNNIKLFVLSKMLNESVENLERMLILGLTEELNERYNSTSTGSYNRKKSVKKINEFLLEFIEKISTVKDLLYLYKSTPKKCNARKCIRKKLIDIILNNIEHASTIKEIDDIPHKTRLWIEIRKKFLNKYDEIVLKAMEEASTLKEAYHIIYHMKRNNSKKANKKIRKIWNERYSEKVKNISTLPFEEAKIIYTTSWMGDKIAQNLALKRLNEILSKEIDNTLSIEYAMLLHYQTPNRSELKVGALKKWHKLFSENVDRVSTPEEANFIYNLAPGESAPALKKLDEIFYKSIERISTIDEAKDLYLLIPEDSDAKSALSKKWGELFSENIEEASTFEEAKTIYNLAPAKSVVKDKIFEKLMDLCSTIEELEFVCKFHHTYAWLHNDSKINELAYKLLTETLTLQEYPRFFCFREHVKQKARDLCEKLLLKNIEDSSTVEEIENFYKTAHLGNPEIFFNKYLQLCSLKNIRDSYAFICKWIGNDNHYKRLFLEKILSLM